MLEASQIQPNDVECEHNKTERIPVMLKAKDSKSNSPYLPSKVYGIDFSGARKAGSKIWIATAAIVGNGIQIEDCRQAKDLLGSAIERDQCLRTLRDFISSEKACAFGLDFPFGLPRGLVKESSWEEFVLSFASRYPSSREFTCITHAVAYGKEWWRETDRKCEDTQAPLPVNNLFLYRQTYHGIRCVLAPLVRNQSICVLPMQRTLPGKPWLLEVCPASTLKKLRLYLLPYKRSDEKSRKHRERIIEGLQETGTILIGSSTLRQKILDDWHGDALDSVIAAFATFRALGNPAYLSVPGTSAYAIEGYIYV